MENFMENLKKDLLNHLFTFLPDADLCNFRKGSNKMISALALAVLTKRRFSYVSSDIRVEIVQFCVNKEITRNDAFYSNMWTYLKEGCNARTRYEAVKDRKEFKDWAPLAVLEKFNEREEKSAPLFRHISRGEIDKLTGALEDSDAWVNTTSESGFPLIHSAITKPDALQILLDHGADVNAVDKQKWTALNHACFSHIAAAAELLLNNGADPNIVDEEGRTALHTVLSRWLCPDNPFIIVKLLLEKGALLNVKDNAGDTPLDLAVKNVENAETIAYLLENEANCEDWGRPLRWAALLHHVDIVEALLPYAKERVNSADKGGDTALHLALGFNGFIDSLIQKQLILDGNFEQCDHFAADKPGYTIVQKLLEMGADVNAANKNGYTPLSIARARSHHPEVVALLIEHGGVDSIRRKRVLIGILLAAALLLGTQRLWQHRAKMQALFHTP